MGHPSVYPTGTTIYNPDKCWNGYTIYNGGYLIDMNGNLVKRWEFSQLTKILPGGYAMGDIRHGGPRMERGRELLQMDWDGNIVWKFNKTEQIKVGDKTIWSAKQHHDFQREGNPVGYYVPEMEPLTDKGKSLILTSREVRNSKIAPSILLGDCIMEVSWDGKIIWEWQTIGHFDEMGFSEEAKNAMYRAGSMQDPYDWMHCNSISYLGPNKWYDAGDERFHPGNIIWDGRNTNTIAIIDKKTGKIIWRVGPNYTASTALRRLGQIIGQHHAHMIPKGLPGEGNILVFDNGGRAGYGAPSPSSPLGVNNARREYSRIIEFNPVTLEKIWEYGGGRRSYRFFSPSISGVQRLPNGNTLICEGRDGRLFEVTSEKEIIWEYMVPQDLAYRAYRVPYEWIPQLEKPVEKAVIPPVLSEFRIEP